MTDDDRVLVFAYGSNMCTERLRERTPGAVKVSIGYLDGHRVAFHKRGRDGSGKATPCPSDPSDTVPGVLFGIPGPELAVLDAAERGYERIAVTIRSRHGETSAQAYFAKPSTIDDTLVPFDWYVALVEAGLREHGLPDEHRIDIGAADRIVDHQDPARRARFLRMARRVRQDPATGS